MLSNEAIQKILGIEDKVFLTTLEMADIMNVTFYPISENASKNIINFSNKLNEVFKELKVNIVPYNEALEHTSLKRRIRRFFKYSINNIFWIYRKLFGLSEVSFYIPFESIFKLSSSKRIKKGISIICLGEQATHNLPMQYINNFKTNSVITIVDFPSNINENSDFAAHFDTSMKLFAYHMTNIIIAVNDKNWMVYNFNASHPIYSFSDNKLADHILETLIPKVIAPISPHTFSDFKLSKSSFDDNEAIHKKIIDDLEQGGKLFEKTKLYPQGKRIDDLPFRHNFHRLIGKLHLDNRSGMSFGFLAYQMPITLPQVIQLEDFKKEYPQSFTDKDFFIDPINANLFILLEIYNKKIVLKVPEIWVMTLRSGSDKTNFNRKKDLLKIGLVNGSMCMEFPKGMKVDRDYKPSFDTKVILAHSVGNAIIASILKYLNSNNQYAKLLENGGLAIAHWHGYFNQKYIPTGMYLHGNKNPHVSCSSPQSAMYALSGKLSSFYSIINKPEQELYKGDIHIEPHHGININFPSLTELAQYILDNPNATELGNKYL